MLRKPALILTVLGLAFAFAAPPPTALAAQKKSTKQTSQKKANTQPKKKKTARTKAKTKYNFRARTYYPWYEGYDGLESFYMQFDRDFGF